MPPPWPSGLKRRSSTLKPVVRARFKPRCGRSHLAPTCNGVRVSGVSACQCQRERAEGTVSSLPGTLNFRMKFCHSTGIVRSGGGVRVRHNKLCLVRALIPQVTQSNIRTKLKKNYMPLLLLQEHVTKIFEEGKTAVAVYLDLKKKLLILLTWTYL